MRRIITMGAFVVLNCSAAFAFDKQSAGVEKQIEKVYLDGLVKTDTVFIDLKNDPDFKFANNLRWFQDAELALFGIKNKKGDVVIEPLFHQIESFVDGVSIVSYDDFQGVIDNKGEILIPYTYLELQTSSENMIAFYENGMWGFFNTKGEKVIPAQYEFVGTFSEGLALASKNQLFGYINTKGKIVIPFQFDYASNFEDGEAQVELRFQNFVINKRGERVAH
ncbi:MAG: WG repeat-containing protein [Flavobacteriaceae bacterium]|jgi:hypothetical protein|nr:WG repeat-containing protein [Flavobacteriaceae bacterium]